MLVFQNPGEIDIRAATTMGINAKTDASAIGFFGTGLKYSIACILRWGGKITIYRGLEPFVFTAEACAVRDKDFSIVCMNGRELGFVTDYGKKWEPWQVYRELFTNTQDEGGTIERSSTVAPAAGMTTVVVECDELETAHDNRAAFILFGEPDFDGEACSVSSGQANSIFYQRLRVAKPPRQCLYTYNLKQKIDLTEDRTMLNAWEFDIAVTRLVDELCNSPGHHHHEIAKTIMLASDEFHEHQVHFGLASSGERSERFFVMAEHLCKHDSMKLNHTIRDLLFKRRPMNESIEIFEPSPFQQKVLAKAIGFSEAIGFKISDYPIICAERLGDGVLGLAHDGTIYITRQAFELGTKMVASTLIEEFIHLREGVHDFTRQMQEILFNRLITIGEEYVWKDSL